MRDSKGRFIPTDKEMTEAQKGAICYKSKLLNKYFDHYDDMLKAEDEYINAHAKEIAVKEERARDLNLVQTTANDYLDVIKKNDEVRKQLKLEEEKAYRAYKDQLDDFAEKHNGYHLTYTRNGNNVEFKIEENHQSEIEKYITEQQERFKKIWDSFWF